MNRFTVSLSRAVLSVVVAGSMAGCAAFRISIDERDPTQKAGLTAEYDQQDLLSLAKTMSEAILGVFPPAGEKAPIMVELGIQNRTQDHLDMKALADTLTTKLLDSGKMQFVDATTRDALLKEQGYQLANCTPDTQAKIGKQLGARYMLTGSLTEIETKSGRQVRVSSQQDVYFQLTVKVTDLETGLVKVSKQIDRMRRASKPIVGW
jgi:uncharacterized protein (TIGR02722 family)